MPRAIASYVNFEIYFKIMAIVTEQGYLLEEDLDSMLQMGAQHYDLLSVGVKEPQPAGD